jgi:hypothetical protein
MLDPEVPGFVEDARRILQFNLPHPSPRQKHRLRTDYWVKATALDPELDFSVTVHENDATRLTFR